MMLGCVFLRFFVKLEHGEVDNPQQRMTVALDAKLLGHMKAQGRKDGACDSVGVGGEQKQVAGLNAGSFLDGSVNLVA